MIQDRAYPHQWVTITRGPYTGETFLLRAEDIDLFRYHVPRYTYQGIWHTNFDLRYATIEEIVEAAIHLLKERQS